MGTEYRPRASGSASTRLRYSIGSISNHARRRCLRVWRHPITAKNHARSATMSASNEFLSDVNWYQKVKTPMTDLRSTSPREAWVPLLVFVPSS